MKTPMIIDEYNKSLIYHVTDPVFQPTFYWKHTMYVLFKIPNWDTKFFATQIASCSGFASMWIVYVPVC